MLGSVGKPERSQDSHSNWRNRDAQRSHNANTRSYCPFAHTVFGPECHALLLSCLVNTYSSFKTRVTSSNLPETSEEPEVLLVLLQKLFQLHSNHLLLSVFIASPRVPRKH